MRESLNSPRKLRSGQLQRPLAVIVLACLGVVFAGRAAAITCPGAGPACGWACVDGPHGTPPSALTSSPIDILYLGGGTFPAWLTVALTTAGNDCNGCAMTAGSHFRPYAVSWTDARGWLPEQFGAFDVLVIDAAAAAAFASLTLEENDPWLPEFRTAVRAVVTSLRVDVHVASMNAFREFAQNTVAWLARDECGSFPSGAGLHPGVFIVGDLSDKPFSYTPWRGLARSHARGPDTAGGCGMGLLALDDVNNPACHEILGWTGDHVVPGCSGNTACSYDRAGASVAALWQAGVASPDCGFESHAFVSVQTAAIAETQPCTYAPPCPGFTGVDVTLVRDLTLTTDFLPVTHAPDLPGTACAYP